MSNVVAQLERAQVLAEQGNESEVQHLLLNLLREQPHQQAALFMLGGSYYVSGKYAESAVIFEQLVTMLPGDGKVSTGLYNALWKQGKMVEAVTEIKRFFQTADRQSEKQTVDTYLKILETLSADERSLPN